jgi:lipoate-protein ligase A
LAGRWRLLVDDVADGAWNMAVDETLLRACEEGGLPTLRLYGWRPATLSLGSRQAAATSHDPDYLRREGIALVRRPTGGRAVLHEHERTYAVVGRRGRWFPGGVLDTYRRIALALRQAFRSLGVPAEVAGADLREPRPGGDPLCFASPSAHEIVVDGRKLVGSAQLRGREAFLQHGSILLGTDARRLGRATGVAADGGRFVGLDEARGRATKTAELDRALVSAFASAFEAPLEPTRLDPSEELAATRLRSWKYLSSAWTLGGRWGEREIRRFREDDCETRPSVAQ